MTKEHVRVAKAERRASAGDRRRKRYADYCANLQARQAEAAAPADDDQADTNPGGQDDGDQHGDSGAANYEHLTADELRAMLKDRELATSGNKPELVARLHEADQATADA